MFPNNVNYTSYAFGKYVSWHYITRKTFRKSTDNLILKMEIINGILLVKQGNVCMDQVRNWHNQHEPSTYKVDEETLHLPEFVVKCKSGDYMNCMFVGGLVSCLHCLCLFAYSGVQHILRCVFLRIVCPVLPVSLDCSF